VPTVTQTFPTMRLGTLPVAKFLPLIVQVRRTTRLESGVAKSRPENRLPCGMETDLMVCAILSAGR